MTEDQDMTLPVLQCGFLVGLKGRGEGGAAQGIGIDNPRALLGAYGSKIKGNWP